TVSTSSSPSSRVTNQIRDQKIWMEAAGAEHAGLTDEIADLQSDIRRNPQPLRHASAQWRYGLFVGERLSKALGKELETRTRRLTLALRTIPKNLTRRSGSTCFEFSSATGPR